MDLSLSNVQLSPRQIMEISDRRSSGVEHFNWCMRKALAGAVLNEKLPRYEERP
jgi:hypothetical protein